jgi:Mn-containing catalase
MFFYRKELMYDVKVRGADWRFGKMLLEQFGGATGELSGSVRVEVENPDDERRTAKAA